MGQGGLHWGHSLDMGGCKGWLWLQEGEMWLPHAGQV